VYDTVNPEQSDKSDDDIARIVFCSAGATLVVVQLRWGT
jgi:hypothetical protein